MATSHTQLTKAETSVTKVYTAFGITPSPTFNSNTTFQPIPAFTTPPLGAGGLEEQYYFHPDHLGSSNYITNIAGDVSQHMEYFAFGETFVEEHKNSINSPYKFNGKELDEESGLYYYGARYYDPRLSIWASVDPLADYNPIMNDEFYFDSQHNDGLYNSFNHGSYTYCYLNPVRLIDPNGKQVESEYLGSLSTSSSMANGMIDGLIDNIPGWGTMKEVGKLATNSEYRAQVIGVIKQIAADPVGFLEKVAKDKIETYKAVLSGTGTDQQNYDFGVDVGGIIPGLIAGGVIVKLLKDLKAQGLKAGIKTTLKQLCFVEGTLVLTSGGLKKIEEIKVGDKVWSFNEQTGELEIKEVVSLSQNISKILIEITINSEKISCTPEHPFFVANNWVDAKDLKTGDKLTLKDGSYVVISSIKRLDKTEKVYNFEVAENHNYYITELGVLVHNNCDFVKNLFSNNVSDVGTFGEQLKKIGNSSKNLTNSPLSIPGIDNSYLPSMTKVELTSHLGELMETGKMTKKQVEKAMKTLNKAFEKRSSGGNLGKKS